MSCDMLEGIKCDGKSVLLTMRASGFAELTIIETNISEDDEFIIEKNTKEGEVATFSLYPNQDGLKNAEQIINALKAWQEHVVKVGLLQ